MKRIADLCVHYCGDSGGICSGKEVLFACLSPISLYIHRVRTLVCTVVSAHLIIISCLLVLIVIPISIRWDFGLFLRSILCQIIQSGWLLVCCIIMRREGLVSFNRMSVTVT